MSPMPKARPLMKLIAKQAVTEHDDHNDGAHQTVEKRCLKMGTLETKVTCWMVC